MNTFKEAVLLHSIRNFIESGASRPNPRAWACPDFVKNNPDLLEGVMGHEAFALYSASPPEERPEMLRWFESSGAEANQMMAAEDWEDWNGSEPPHFDLQHLNEHHTEVYRRVVEGVVEKVYASLEADTRKLIIAKFTESPETFMHEIERQRR